MSDFSFTVDKNKIATLSWNVKKSSMNVLSLSGIQDLEEKVNEIINNDEISGVIFNSKKKDFSAGADLNMINELGKNKSYKEETFNQIMRIHNLLRKLETTGKNEGKRNKIKPVVWACNGISAGIGTEIGLACHYRIATDNPRTKIGLPEILVGLFPFGGGTTRISRMIGIMAAAPILLEGKMFSSKKAQQIGIINEVVKENDLLNRAKEWILSSKEESLIKPWDNKKFKMPGGSPYHPSGFMTFVGASAMISSKTKGIYPAPKVLLSTIYEGSMVPFDTALKIEARWATYLLNIESTKNMVRSLFVSKTALEKGAVRPKIDEFANIKEIGILGAGMMGAGIAQVSCLSNIRVVLFDKTLKDAINAKNKIEEELRKDLKSNRIDNEKFIKSLSLISPSDDFDSLKNCDLIIEAVFEDINIKGDILSKVCKHLKNNAILASNTSTLPITDLSKYCNNPETFIGIHFFSPVNRMKLVEIIKGKDTNPHTVATAMDFCKIIKKTPIVVNDERFFYANRCIIPYVNEGVTMVGQGINPSLIENAAKQLGMPLGPLQLIDETSIQLAEQIAKETRKALGKSYVYSIFDEVLEFMIKNKRFGRKSNAGFYDYNEKGKRVGLWNGIKEKWKMNDNFCFDEIKDRLALIQALEAVRAFENKVLTDIREGDVGAILGWGCLPWAGGPFSWIDLVGLKEIEKKCDFLSEKYGKRFKTPELIKKLSISNKNFYEQFSYNK